MSPDQTKFIIDRLKFNSAVINEFEVFSQFYSPENHQGNFPPQQVFAEGIKSFVDMYLDLCKSSGDRARAKTIAIESVKRDLVYIITGGDHATETKEQESGKTDSND